MKTQLALVLMIAALTQGTGVAAVTASNFSSAGVNIHYVVEGDGAPVVLVHGFTGSLQIWVDSRAMDTLVAAGYRVIALDLRGHGASDKPATPEAYGLNVVDDIRRLLDHLGIDKAHIVGYSMGGKVVASFGEQHPDRALSLTLGGSGHPFWAPDAMTTEQVAESMGGRVEAGLVDPAAIAALTNRYPDMLPDDDGLRTITKPTLVIVGDSDDGVSGENRTAGAKVLSTIILGSRYVTVPGDHGEAVRSAEFVDEILRFLRDVDRPDQ